jgi:Tol biopolymer transport system component
MGVRQIYVRTLDQTNLQPVPGTDSAISVALSSDGRTAAFVTNDTQLKRVSFANGVVEPLVTGVMLFSGPAWVSDGAIVYSRGARLMLRSRDGAERELAAVDTEAGEISLSWPVPTADNRTILFVSRRKSTGGLQSRVESVPLAGGPRRLVLDGAEQVVFASADRLVFARNGTLYTAPFDMARAATIGTPTRLAEAVVEGSVGGIAAAIAAAGTLLVAPSSVLANHLVSVSMDGGERPIRSEAREFRNPRMSPDGRVIAFSEAGAVWTLDPERGAFTRVSTIRDRTVGFAIWSPDGTRIYYRSADGIRYQSADGEGASTLLPNTVQGDYPNSFTPDGATLVIIRVTAENGGDIYTTPAAGGNLKPLVASKSYEGGPEVSPDGKWLTYVSDESGRFEVYLRPIGGPDRKWPVSSEGGVHAIWGHNGRQIFYRSGRRVLSVDVTTTPEVRLSAPRLLFENRYVFGQNLTIPNYSLTADGREFIMVEEEPGGRHLNLVLNWWQGSR